jgi:hypothetical protein
MKLVCHPQVMLELNCDIPLGSFYFMVNFCNVVTKCFCERFHSFSVNVKKLLYTWKNCQTFETIKLRKKTTDYTESINNFECHLKLATHCKLECFKTFCNISRHKTKNNWAYIDDMFFVFSFLCSQVQFEDQCWCRCCLR